MSIMSMVQGYGVLITQAIFNEITLDLLKDTEIKVQSTLQASGLKWEEIDHILLVGGSTRMPMIRQMIRLMSGLEPKFDLNPDTIVAQGHPFWPTLSSITRLASLSTRMVRQLRQTE